MVNNGVSVFLECERRRPGTTFQATITNTGTVPDTFDLSLGGPAALVASLGMTTKVKLDPGDSQVVPITTTAVNFAVPGTLGLMVTAQSETDAAVQAAASANLTIAASTGFTASFTPDSQTLPAPAWRRLF